MKFRLCAVAPCLHRRSRWRHFVSYDDVHVSFFFLVWLAVSNARRQHGVLHVTDGRMNREAECNFQFLVCSPGVEQKGGDCIDAVSGSE